MDLFEHFKIDKTVAKELVRDLNKYYVQYSIQKKNKKGFRVIHAPQGILKTYQKRISAQLYKDAAINMHHAYAFIQGRSAVENAKEHIGKKYIVRLDLKNFFYSITRTEVIRVLRYIYLSRFIAIQKVDAYEVLNDLDTIAWLCCLPTGRLPQGAPTSPILSNMICNKIDKQLTVLEKEFECRITRYADDIVISGKYPKLFKTIDRIKILVRDMARLSVNREKTLIMKRNMRQRVTGVVVNTKTNMPREARRNLRAAVHNINANTTKETLLSIRGKIAWLEQLNPTIGLKTKETFLSNVSSAGLTLT